MKKCVLVPDSFKGTISSEEVCAIMRKKLSEHYPACAVSEIPVADGGEGTVDCFLKALGGEKVFVSVKGPFFEEMQSFYGLIESGSTAVIEMASCAGLKGSDGIDIQEKARAMGVTAQSGARTGMELALLYQAKEQFELLTAPGEMGEDAALCAGFVPVVVGEIEAGKTTAADTVSIARQMETMGADIIAFSGGDGTARNLYEAVGLRVPAIGIPSGVKIHSAVYAINPQSAGKVLLEFAQGTPLSFCEGEVMDIDEEAFRQGRVQAQLYGYLRVPVSRRLMQSAKSGGYSEREALAGMALEVIGHIIPGDIYIIGSGTTPRGIMEQLDQPNTLLGVDVLQNSKLVAADVNEQELYAILQTGHTAHMVLTVIGGQGHIFGRGNQQLSPRIIRLVGKEHIQIVASKSKLIALRGAPLLIDTGDRLLDGELCGYYRIITGYEDYMPYRAEA